MISENTKLNIILGILCVVFVIVILYIISYRNNLESANVYFKTDEIRNTTWSNEDVTLKFDKDKYTLTIDNQDVIKDEVLKLNVHTGELKDGSLYLRSVNDNNIIIWYNEAEYKLDKK